MPVAVDGAVLAGFRLSVCGIRELDAHAGAGVTHVVSILDPAAPLPEAFGTFAEPRSHAVLRFDDVIHAAPGSRPPEPHHIEALLAFGDRLAGAETGAHLLVHCHAGISRSTAAAAILLAQRNPGREPAAFAAVGAMRPHAWPNTRMVEIADLLLGRRGGLIAALASFRRTAIVRAPWMSDMVRAAGRGHELP